MSDIEMNKGAKGNNQRTDFLTGNEAAALASRDINYHVMGYYPMPPSTEVAENLSQMQANGEHNIAMVSGDGEHGAAGICYGASLGGGRVISANSANGLLYALEQLPVQSGTRSPMVLNLVARTVSGPLNIRCDHSDLYFTLNTGWIILLARDPQAVYDLNLAAVKVSEHPDVRLPVILCYDGYFTSHQKRRISVFENADTVKAYVGEPNSPITALDPKNPIIFGASMNDSDTINNKKQLSLAMEAARRVIPEVLHDLEKITGRSYPILEAYRMEDAEYAVILLNSAAETAKEAADKLREKGQKVGVLSPNVMRPFPAEAFRTALKNVKAIVIGDRADSYGADGGNLSLEIRAALQQDPENKTVVLSRIYGLGGKEFYEADAKAFFELAQNSTKTIPFDYYGTYKGEPDRNPPKGIPVVNAKESSRKSMAKVTQVPETGKLQVELDSLWAMAEFKDRIAPGHGACPGCGIFPILHQIYNVLEGDLVILFHGGCGMMVTSGYPKTAHRITYIHNLSQNGAATLSGLVEMYYEKVRRGELPASDDLTFLMMTGDGGMDIGMGSAIGAANRNHRMMIIEYDNQGYMDTGGQFSSATPIGHRTTTSEVGSVLSGKPFHHKDTTQIFAACHLPYVFTASEGFVEDLMRKVAKAQWYAKREGLVYGKIMSFCPLNWDTPDSVAQSVMQAALDCCFFPLYEVEKGKTTITYEPDVLGKRIPVVNWLKRMGKTKHLLKPKNAEILKSFEAEVNRRWKRIKAMHEHEEL